MVAIKPGIIVQSAEKNRPATLGVIVDVSGVLYGFLPGYAVAPGEAVYDAGGVLIGRAVQSGSVNPSEGRLPIAQSLTAVRLTGDCDISGRQMEIVDPVDCVGRPVRKVNAAGAVAGVISAIDGPFHLHQGEGNPPTVYHGIIEVTADESAKVGDGGSAIIVENEKLVGILLGVAGSRYACVPAINLIEILPRGSKIASSWV